MLVQNAQPWTEPLRPLVPILMVNLLVWFILDVAVFALL